MYWPGPGCRRRDRSRAHWIYWSRVSSLGLAFIAIAPYTNLWLLEQRRPGILTRAALYLMGWNPRPTPPVFPACISESDYNVSVTPWPRRQSLNPCMRR